MITYIHDVHYGYQMYNIDELWLGLSQMGNIDEKED